MISCTKPDTINQISLILTKTELDCASWTWKRYPGNESLDTFSTTFFKSWWDSGPSGPEVEVEYFKPLWQTLELICDQFSTEQWWENTLCAEWHARFREVKYWQTSEIPLSKLLRQSSQNLLSKLLSKRRHGSWCLWNRKLVAILWSP